jgi:hypothetical protein
MKRLLSALFVAFVSVALSAQWVEDTPAYHAAPPAQGAKLPPILTPDKLTGPSAQYAYQKHSYVLASRVDKLLYQQPCYCHCDKSHGHTSLRSCFETQHGANCSVCMAEAVYTYQENKKGRNASQIRQGIMSGEFRNIQLETTDKVN